MNLLGAATVITGASRGLGRSLAFAFAARGARLALIGRGEASLAPTLAELQRRGASARGYGLDLRNYQDCAAVLRAIAADLGTVDVLVCNAATGTAGAAVDVPMSAYQDNLAVNFLAPVELSREFLRQPSTPNRRAICFILSGAALRGLPAFSAYATGKAALAAFADALRIELAGRPVHVTTIFPGTMDTEFTARMPRVGDSAVIVESNRRSSPDAIAERVVRAIERDRPRLFMWGPARLVHHLDSVAPGLVDRLLVRMQRRALARGK